jgi:hypothetical protein
MELKGAKSYWASTPVEDDAVDKPQQVRPIGLVRRVLPAFVLGLGLVATLAWIGLLGWLLYRAVKFLALG